MACKEPTKSLMDFHGPELIQRGLHKMRSRHLYMRGNRRTASSEFSVSCLSGLRQGLHRVLIDIDCAEIEMSPSNPFETREWTETSFSVCRQTIICWTGHDIPQAERLEQVFSRSESPGR